MTEEQIRALLGRHLPGQPARQVRPLGEGLDNTAFVVDGELVVRFSKADDAAETVRREAELLRVVAQVSPVDTPVPVFVELAAGVMAYRMVRGVSLLGRPITDARALGATLGGFVDALRAVPASTVRDLVDLDPFEPAEALAEAKEDHRVVADHLPPPAAAGVARFLDTAPPPAATALVLCHNDLGAEHVLVDPDTGAVTGVIDWTDAAFADPAYDLGLIYRDLGPEVFAAAITRYTGPWDDADTARAVFHARCALLGDLVHGVETGDRRYTEAALAHLPHTFG